MRITVSGRHTEVDEALKAHTTEKTEKLTRYYDRLLSVDVIFDEQAGTHVVEMIARADHHATFIAKHDDHDPYATVDQVVKEIERQLTRHKEKFRNRKHSAAGADKRDLTEGTSSGT